MTLRERLDTCDAAIRSHLDPDERVLAVGRCEDITYRGNIEAGGAASAYIMVTDRRLRWVPHVDLDFEASLDLITVKAARERSVGHRYAIALEHAPLTRSRTVPAHRFLRFQWGNAVATTPMTRTRFAFSRRDTEVAVALREQLSRRMTH